MDQLAQYLEQLVSTSASELHLIPNAAPYLVSPSGTSELDKSPLQGSQISMMVFPLIPPDVKQDLPNQPSVQFHHPSNIGDFDFTIHKTPAGFKVTIRPTQGTAQPSPSLSAAPGPESRHDQTLPSIDLSTSSFPAIDLQPINEPVVTTAPFASTDSGLPEFETSAGVSSVDGLTGQTTSDFFAAMTPESIEGAQEYVPPPERQVYIPTEEVVRNPVSDRRTRERTGSNSEMKERMENLFLAMEKAGASDLHLSVGMPPIVRTNGCLQKLQYDEDVLAEDTMIDLLHSIMPERNKEEFADCRNTGFACEVAGVARFRTKIYMDRNGMGATFRYIPAKIPSAEQLGLPNTVMALCDPSPGLVLVAGRAGSGRSTTLSAMIGHINQSRKDHIITIEEPVEFVHENGRCIVNQREVPDHILSFRDGIRAAVSEDPNVIMLSEIPDTETLLLAFEAAVSGRLVFSTLHAGSVAAAIEGMIGRFTADRQQQVRDLMSQSLKGVVFQTLAGKSASIRTPGFEVLRVDSTVSNLIREGRTSDIPSTM